MPHRNPLRRRPSMSLSAAGILHIEQSPDVASPPSSQRRRSVAASETAETPRCARPFVPQRNGPVSGPAHDRPPPHSRVLNPPADRSTRQDRFAHHFHPAVGTRMISLAESSPGHGNVGPAGRFPAGRFPAGWECRSRTRPAQVNGRSERRRPGARRWCCTTRKCRPDGSAARSNPTSAGRRCAPASR